MGAFVFAGVTYFSFLFKSFFVVNKEFLSNFMQFLQFSFGLSIKSTHEIKRYKVT